MKISAVEYKKLVDELPLGKRLPTAVYLHREHESLAGATPLGDLVNAIIRNSFITENFNVIKFHTDTPRISFLTYPAFETDPHPALQMTITVDLLRGKIRSLDYNGSANPPILHRKEALLTNDDPRRPIFEALTIAEEAEGLYRETQTIGFKLNWEQLLGVKGLYYEGHSLKRRTTPGDLSVPVNSAVGVHRHKTAIFRQGLSKPVKLLIESGQLTPISTFFDYGCGRGEDITGLRGLRYLADGWDPKYFPDAPKKKAEVVNLGYVLNVIEDPVERVATLIDAWSHCERLLVVSALLRAGKDTERAVAFPDGIITCRNTFQKQFDQHELQQYIEDALETSAIPVQLGVFFVFRNPKDQQDFLSNRTKRSIDWIEVEQDLLVGQVRERPKARDSVSFYERHKELLDDFWECVLQLGRIPLPEEYERFGEILQVAGSSRKALRALANVERHEQLRTAQQKRKSTLLVYLARANLSQRVPYRFLSTGLRLDMKTFFGNYQKAQTEGLALLYSVGNSQRIAEACELSKDGWQDAQALYIHKSLLDDLAPLLRTYVVCAETLYGAASQADLIKLHKSSGKVTFLLYDDFESKPLPELLTRMKVNLRSQEVELFDHSQDQQLLIAKERFLSAKHPDYDSMAQLTERLREIGVPTNTFLGPSKSAFQEIVKRDARKPSSSEGEEDPFQLRCDL